MRRSSGVVLRNVGVEQIDVHPPDAQFPNPGENFPIENRHRNEKLHFAAASFADWQVIKILVQINRCLNAVLIDLLPEIAVAIEQTNRDEIQIEIARRFAMIAGQNAEAAGVIRNRFVKTELGGKIGDRILDRGAGPGLPVRVLASEIFLEILENLFELPQKSSCPVRALPAGIAAKAAACAPDYDWSGSKARGRVAGTVGGPRVPMSTRD